jgi:signal transduction histidine kinase
LRGIFEPLFLSLVATLLAAWAYGRRGGWLTAGLAIGLQAMGALAAATQGVAARIIFSVLGLQFAELVVASYIVGTLAEQERNHTQALKAANEKLREQAAAMEQLAVLRERNRLARDLHDTLAHSLAGLVVQLEAIETLTQDAPVSDQARAEIDKARRAAQSGLEETRRAIRDLRVNPVEDLGLARALEQAAGDFSDRTGVRVNRHLSEPKTALSGDTAAAIWRIALEVLNNVERHAGAQYVELMLAQENGKLVLSIADDGRGFDPSHLGNERFGLIGMRERAELIGADLTVASEVGRGTSVRLVLPLK